MIEFTDTDGQQRLISKDDVSCVTEYSSSETLIMLKSGVMFYVNEDFRTVKEKLR